MGPIRGEGLPKRVTTRVFTRYGDGNVVNAYTPRSLYHCYRAVRIIVDTTGAPELESLFDDAQVAKTQPPLFWGYDPADPIVSSDRIAETGNWLRPRVQLEERTYNGVGHGIHPDEIGHLVNFIEKHVHETVSGS